MAENKLQSVNVTLNMSALIFSKVYLNNTKILFVRFVFVVFFFPSTTWGIGRICLLVSRLFSCFKLWQLCSLFWLCACTTPDCARACPVSLGLLGGDSSSKSWVWIRTLGSFLGKKQCREPMRERKTPCKDTSAVTEMHKAQETGQPNILDKLHYPILLNSLSPSIHAWSNEDQTLGQMDSQELVWQSSHCCNR